MKKLLLVFVLAAIVATGAFADHPSSKLGIGVMGGWHGHWSGGAGVPGFTFSLKIPEVPIFWGIALGIGSGYFDLSVIGDYYLFEGTLVSNIDLHWFFGVGGWVNIGLGDPFHLSLGARLPIGISWHVIDFIEIFLNVSPSLGLQVAKSIHFPAGGWPIELGIRFWI